MMDGSELSAVLDRGRDLTRDLENAKRPPEVLRLAQQLEQVCNKVRDQAQILNHQKQPATTREHASDFGAHDRAKLDEVAVMVAELERELRYLRLQPEQRESSENLSSARRYSPHQISAALDRCDWMVHWYEKHLARARLAYRLFRTVTVIVAALTSVLTLLQLTGVATPNWPTAAGVALLVATVLGGNPWRGDWIRYAVAAEKLRSERTKFTTRTTQDYSLALSDEEAFNNFVYRIESLAISEVPDWRHDLVTATSPGGRQYDMPTAVGHARESDVEEPRLQHR